MNKIALLLTAMLIAGVAAIRLTGNPVVTSWDWAAEQRQLESIANYECFKQAFDDTLAELGEGKIGSREARERVYSAARRYRPDYLTCLDRSEPGTTDIERIAHNLVGHLRCTADVRPGLRPRVQELEIELECDVRPSGSI